MMVSSISSLPYVIPDGRNWVNWYCEFKVVSVFALYDDLDHTRMGVMVILQNYLRQLLPLWNAVRVVDCGFSVAEHSFHSIRAFLLQLHRMLYSVSIKLWQNWTAISRTTRLQMQQISTLSHDGTNCLNRPNSKYFWGKLSELVIFGTTNSRICGSSEANGHFWDRCSISCLSVFAGNCPY